MVNPVTPTTVLQAMTSKHSLHRWRGQWLQFKARALAVWRALAPRERRMLVGTALLLMGLFSWLVLIQPPLQKIEYWQVETAKLRGQSQALEQLLREVPVSSAGQSLEAALRQSLDARGLAGYYQLTPMQSGWQLTFEAAQADVVIGWLIINPRQFSLYVVEARLQRASEAETDDRAGTLSGTVRMDQARDAKEAS